MRPPCDLVFSLGNKTRSVVAQEVTLTVDIKIKAARTVNCLNCVSPNDGPKIATRSSVPIIYPRRPPTDTIRLACIDVRHESGCKGSYHTPRAAQLLLRNRKCVNDKTSTACLDCSISAIVSASVIEEPTSIYSKVYSINA